jgi:hypothetical protein
VLRSSVLGTTQKRVEKASVLSNPSRKAGDRPVTSQCPSKKHGPLRRTKCGRRERESRREGRREQSLRERIPSRVVAVKGIPVFRMAALFAGRRRNEDLGWSVSSAAVPCCKRARRRQRMSEGRRGGERRRHAPQSVCTRRGHERSSQANNGDASFARSFDPCTSILTMLSRGNSRR